MSVLTIIGILVPLVAAGVLIVVFVPFFRGRAQHRRAADELPKTAERLGLRFHPNPSPDLIGRFTGSFKGRSVVMRPDNWGLIRLPFQQELPICIGTSPDEAQSAPELRTFESGDPRFDQVFPVRHGSESAAELVRSEAELRSALLEFVDRWGSTLGNLTIDPTTLSVQQPKGSGGLQMHHSIPAESLEEILSALVSIADRLEQSVR